MNASFDIAAGDYDKIFTNSRIGKSQRKRVWQYVDKLLDNSNDQKILELNCGTGEDAIYFARKGHQVLATDVSEKMIEVTKAKIENTTSQNKVVTNILDLKNPQLKEGKKYDLIFSNFGGLNCISQKEMVRLSQFLFPYLNNGGHCVFVIMPPFTIIEKWFRKYKGQSDIYERRNSDAPLQINVSGELVNTYFHSEASTIGAFSLFDHQQTKPIGYIPSYLEKSKVLWLLQLIEKMAFTIKLQPNKTDHYLIHFQKK